MERTYIYGFIVQHERVSISLRAVFAIFPCVFTDRGYLPKMKFRQTYGKDLVIRLLQTRDGTGQVHWGVADAGWTVPCTDGIASGDEGEAQGDAGSVVRATGGT